MSARTTGDGIVDFSRPIVREGAFRGIVSISLFTQYFHRFHTELVADEPGLAINLFHESGEIYARTPTLPNAPDRLSDDSPVVARIRAGQRAAEIRGVSSVDQRDRLIAFRKIDGYPIYVGTGIDVADIRQELWNELARVLVFGIPLVVALYFTARLALRRTNETLQASERLRQEMQNRQRTETALQHSQKLEALGRLTGGVAHDFNNALMVISNNLFILSRKHPEVGTAQVQSISRAITSATKLTRQLLAFSRVQALVPEVVNLQDRLSSVKDMLSPVLGGQVTLTIDVAADTPAIFVDAAELELALVNLAINSRDAMPRGGAFTLNARLKTTDLPPLLSRPMVAIEAIDTGTGIESTILPKVFEPFFTTKEVGQGTGLGLSQIYGLCQRAGGTATVTSTVGAGTTVTLYFPAYGDAGPPAPTLKSQKPLHLSKQVLLVEDNEEVASALAPLLEAIGCRVHTLCNAPDALVWLHEKRPLPDVLLSDIVMPGEFDGLTLARHVRAAFPAIGIVLMTGYFAGMPEIERQGFEVLPKPCTADMLAEAIQRVAVNSSS